MGSQRAGHDWVTNTFTFIIYITFSEIWHLINTRLLAISSHLVTVSLRIPTKHHWCEEQQSQSLWACPSASGWGRPAVAFSPPRRLYTDAIFFYGGSEAFWQLSGLTFNTSFLLKMGFPGSSAGKESTCNAEDPSSIPGLGRSNEEGTGYPLQ